MAQSKDNIITHGLSGKVGDLLVFSQRNGKTIVSRAPKSHESTEKQKEVQHRFQEAVLYAKSSLADPLTKAAYEAGAHDGQSAYNVAVADFFNAPDIEQIDLTHYTGKKGDKIIVRVTDDFSVKSVIINISNGDGSIVEEGAAVKDGNGLDWIYTATTVNTNLAGDKITVKATDQPGNISKKAQILP